MSLAQTVPSKELKNKIGSVFSRANREPVRITRNGRFSYVLLSADDWKMIGGEPAYRQKKSHPYTQKRKAVKKKNWEDSPLFGMWADREDMEDVEAYVRNMRKPRF